ncbi:MAG: carbohydrate ABC transporter permease [Ruminococcaceae bacterium]|nr:carbohydrate ABC transporter permease [Oscillospiraceae bacterium]
MKMKKKMFQNMESGALCNSDMKQVKYKLFYGFLWLIMLFWFIVVILPCLWMAFSGFKTAAEINATENVRFFPETIELGKLVRAWNILNYKKYYLNTFIMAIGCVVADVFASGLAGYVLSRLRPKGHKLIMGLVFCLMLLPTTGTTVPLFVTFKNGIIPGVSMLNTYWPMWLMSAANMFNVMLFKTSFDGVSSSLVEAAKIDGANNLSIFVKIMIPLSVPVIITVSLFTFNAQFGNFFWPNLVLIDPEKYTLGVQIYKIQQVSNASITDDIKMMGILFSILPQLVVFALFQKHIMGGINLGGVKG